MQNQNNNELEEGEVDISQSNRNVWLVKIPEHLSQQWSSISDNNAELGRLHVMPNGAINLRVPDMGNEIPLEYKVKNKSRVPLYVLSKSEDGKMSVDGNVNHNLQLYPQPSSNYRKLVEQRANKPKTGRKTRKTDTKPIVQPLAGDVDRLRRKEQQTDMSNKRVRMDSDQLETKLFQLFEQKPFWRLKELEEETHQPSAFLKEKLDTLCFYHRSGEHRNCYELLSEYK